MSYRQKTCLALCATLAMLPLAASAGGLSVNRSALMAGETLEVTYQSDAATSNNAYVAILADNKVFFMDGSGAFSLYQTGAATPAWLERPAAGTHRVLTFTVPQNFNYDLGIFVAEASSGADILASASGSYNVHTRRAKFVTTMARPSELDSASASASRGATLYQQQCFACHNNPSYNLGDVQKGISPIKTLGAIGKFNPMKYLKTTRDEAIDIAAWLVTAR